MKRVLGVLYWALIGSLAMGALAYAGVYFLMFGLSPGRTAGHELENLAAMILGLFSATIGLVLGGIYGAARARKVPLLQVIGSSLIGAALAALVTPGIFSGLKMVGVDPEFFLTRGQRTSGSGALMAGLCGAIVGFVLGSAYRIVRGGRQDVRDPPNAEATHQEILMGGSAAD
jgi:hypothetical protein